MVYIDMREVEKVQEKSITRRNFLLTSGMLLMSGKMVYDSIIDVMENNERKQQEKEQKDITDKIYNEYKKYQHFSATKSKITMNEDGKNVEHLLRGSHGYGIVVNDKYVTVTHAVNGITPALKDLSVDTEQTTMLYGVRLDNIIMDVKNDFAVFQIPKELEIKNRFDLDDICFDEPKLGEEMYVIGNPELYGVNIRKGCVSDIDGAAIGNSKGNPLKFGLDTPGIGGDSGTFVVNKQGKVAGIISETLSYISIYGIKMKAYEPFLVWI